MSTHTVDGRQPTAAPDAPATALGSRHLLGIDGMTAGEITLILDTAEAMKEVGHRPIKKVPTLRGRTAVSYTHLTLPTILRV